ncbi:ImmA/IrrE family metallo-endopeptidase [Sporosarcina ureilytica]|uniref:IrrE N-terminal-like domain-containing protein n=1 Tax=Sporosarcina ureilytica TaxID=298596 RepID=A0A1D8JGR4_9BACL|nr:ImmA/IrrE family metallo-endopeptidase [Sporosarcina ureilytica]AOV07905.1 hypothetical protein BI350_10395 [Sporosarcina ureilytica]
MSYTYSHLEDLIQKIYHELNIHNPNELTPNSIAESLNIGIYPVITSSQALQFEGRYYIFLNNSLTASERFEMFVHELGHILMHTGNQQHMKEDYRTYQEWKANLFALHFCVPTFMLQKLPAYHLNDHKISDLFGVTSDFACKRLNLNHQRILQYQSMKILQRRTKNYYRTFYI